MSAVKIHYNIMQGNYL